MAAALLAVTVLLCLAGVLLYEGGAVGWAQLCWVVGSGTAGAGIAGVVSGRW